MTSDELTYRRKALEESFFARRNQELLDKLRAQHNRDQQKTTLAELTGTSDPAVLERMLDLGIRPETWTAMTYIPMIAVAWADEVLDTRERQAILEAAAKQGITADGAGYQLLQSWLDENPGSQIVEAWKDYVQALLPTLDPAGRERLKQHVLELARGIAKAAGGILGMHAIGAREKRVLSQLSAVFE